MFHVKHASPIRSGIRTGQLMWFVSPIATVGTSTRAALGLSCGLRATEIYGLAGGLDLRGGRACV